MTIGRIIDISSNNHPNNAPIAWASVAQAGVTAVFVKATEGTNYVNPYFRSDMLGAKNAGLAVCGYHFASMGDPVAEANYFKGYAANYARVLDYETNTNVTWARTFLQTLGWPAIEQCMTYGSVSTLKDFYQQLPSMAWPAAYGQNYPGWGACWQFTDKATIPGITGPVDENRWYGSELQYDTIFQITPQPPPAPPPYLVEGETMTSMEIGGQVHVWGVVNGAAYHWWQQAPTGDPTHPADPTWHFEKLPA